MQVRIYDCDHGAETLRGECDLRECFPDDQDDFERALAELQRSGRVWCAGGSQPLVLLMMADR